MVDTELSIAPRTFCGDGVAALAQIYSRRAVAPTCAACT